MKLDQVLKQKAPKTLKLLDLLSWTKRIAVNSAIGELCEAIEYYVDMRCSALQAEIDKLKEEKKNETE